MRFALEIFVFVICVAVLFHRQIGRRAPRAALTRATPSLCCRYAIDSIAHIDEKNQTIKQLEDQLLGRDRGRGRGGEGQLQRGGRGGEEDGGRGGGKAGTRAVGSMTIKEFCDEEGSAQTAEIVGIRRGDDKNTLWRARRCSRSCDSSSRKDAERALLTTLPGLRSDLQCLKSQV